MRHESPTRNHHLCFTLMLMLTCVLFGAGNAAAQCGSDPGNDNLATATALPGCGSTPASIDCAGDLDYYWLNAPSSGDFVFETTGSIDTELRLYDLNGDAIAFDDDSGNNHNARISFFLTAGQKYSVAVNEYGYDGTGDYTLVISGCDTGCGNDPGNDYLALATPLQGCGTTPASIDCIGDVDFYWFNATISGDYVVETSGGTDTELRLYDLNGDPIASDNDSGQGHNARIIHALVGGQKYSVAVNESLDDATGDYTLEITGCDQGGCGNDPQNDTRGEATDLGNDCGTTDAAFDCVGDVDFYRFTATSTSEYVFETNGPMDTYMELMNHEGQSLATNDDGGDNQNSRIAHNLSMGSTYFIRINEYQDNDTGAYSLSITGCGGGPCGDDPGNDTIGDFTHLDGCGTTSAAIDCPGDLDYYGFVPPNTQGGDFTIETTGGLDTELRLYDANGDAIESDDNSGNGNNARIVHALAYGVRYYVGVNEKGYDDTGNYDLVISGCGSTGCGNDPGNDYLALATPLQGCGSTPASIDCIGDVDFYWFNATISGDYVIETSGGTDTELRLYDLNGDPIATDNDSGQGHNARIIHALVGGQKYSVAVNESLDDATGDYTLEIAGCDQGGCGNDPQNDTPGDATDLGNDCGTTDAAFDCVGDVDFYRFTATSDSEYVFETTGSMDTMMELFDDEDHQLANDDDGGDNQNSRIAINLSQGETYFVRINEYQDNDTGAYSLSITGCGGGPCGNDPGNDTIGDFTHLASCGTTSAAIDCPGDLDYYGFVPPNTQGGDFTIETTGGLDTELRLYDANGDAIESDDNSGSGNNARIVHALAYGVRYYVGVNEKGYDDIGNYELVITGCGAGACGSDPGNDDRGTATELAGACGTTDAAFDCVGDLDFYRFTAPNDGQFTFETSGSTDTFMELLDDEGHNLATNDDGGQDHNSLINYGLTQGESYFIRLNEYNDDGTGDYSLSITGCSGGGSCGNDPGDDDFQTASLFSDCGTTQAEIDCAADEDFYAFAPPHDGPFTITLQASFNCGIELYDGNHTLIAQDNYQISRDLTAGAVPYYVVVSSPLGLIGGYDLSIAGCSSSGCSGDQDGDDIGSASDFNQCGTRDAEFDCVGDVDYFRFVPPISGEFVIETSGSMDTKLWLQDAAGNDLAFDDDSGQGYNARIVANLASGQTYFVRLEEYNNDDTGGYSLIISGCQAPGCGQDSEGDTFGDAVGLSACGLTGAALDCQDDRDVFRFEAPLDVDYTMTTLGDRDTLIRLYDGNGSLLQTDSNSGAGSNASVTTHVAATDVVFVEVSGEAGSQGDYQLEISGCDATGQPPTLFRYVVTATAKVSGAAGTNWVSDLSVLNLGDTTAQVVISLWERDRANLNPQQSTVTLASGEMLVSTDVLADRFGLASGAAALELSSDQPLAIGSRTYNTVSSRTYGQFIPGVDVVNAFAAQESVVLSGITENQSSRTNMGLVNPGLNAIQVTGQFFTSKGNSLGSRTWTVPAQGYIQRNRILREVSNNALSGVWVLLSADAGDFFAFVSMVDQQSGDPVYRPAQRRPSLAGDVLMPGVAKLAGAAGTNWVTDAIFTNTSATDASVKVALWNRDGNNSTPDERSMLVKAGRAVELADVLHSLFGRDSGAAALQIVVEPGVVADGRTYNQVTDGTYGQYIPALTGGLAVTHHRKGYMVMSADNAGFRTNLGFVNPTDRATDVQVRLFNAAGVQVGVVKQWSLNPRAVVQYNRILRQFTNQAVDAGWLEISVPNTTPDGQVQVFNSVVDQVSGDPIFETVTLEP